MKLNQYRNLAVPQNDNSKELGRAQYLNSGDRQVFVPLEVDNLVDLTSTRLKKYLIESGFSLTQINDALEEDRIERLTKLANRYEKLFNILSKHQIFALMKIEKTFENKPEVFKLLVGAAKYMNDHIFDLFVDYYLDHQDDLSMLNLISGIGSNFAEDNSESFDLFLEGIVKYDGQVLHQESLINICTLLIGKELQIFLKNKCFYLDDPKILLLISDILTCDYSYFNEIVENWNDQKNKVDYLRKLRREAIRDISDDSGFLQEALEKYNFSPEIQVLLIKYSFLLEDDLFEYLILNLPIVGNDFNKINELAEIALKDGLVVLQPTFFKLRNLKAKS